MTRFSTPWQQPDLDIHPDPAEGWHRVAVVGLWTDAKVLRRDWPEAAVVGPLRTLRGIDMLVRSLLANPQIRVLVVTGRDLSPGESVRKALNELWQTDSMPYLLARCQEYDWPLNALVDLLGMRGVGLVEPAWMDFGSLEVEGRKGQWNIGPLPILDRPGGAILLPPPPPPENPELPAGLPGQRITGRTLADVWSKVLHEVLRFGDQAGDTRELLNLVSVIKDPKASLAEFGRGGQYEPTPEGMAFKAPPHPILGISWADLDDYYSKSFMGSTQPEGLSYTYGSRLHGGEGVMLYDAPEVCMQHPNQLARVRALLQSTPSTRAAWLTPWRPDEDCGTESGRPCWTGALLRAVPSVYEWDIRLSGEATARPVAYKLHLTVTFRSHDVHGAYPLNLAACCRWLCEEAEALNMEVGTVTCVSMSAHVYDHALEAADKVVSEHVKPGAWSQDPRSAWRVWSTPSPYPVGFTWTHDGEYWEVLEAHATGTSYLVRGPRGQIGVTRCNMRRQLGAPARFTYHAEASDPEGTRVLQLFEASTKERLIRDIQASGLVTSIQHAIWLGAEVGKL